MKFTGLMKVSILALALAGGLFANDLDDRYAALKDAQAKKDPDAVKKLADDLQTAVSGRKKLVAAQQLKLAREVHALFNSAHLTATQQDTLVTDVQKILADGGASLDDAVNVATDLKAVVSQTK